MPKKLEDEEIQEIVDTWEGMDEPSYNAVSKETGYSRDAVKRYVDEHTESEDVDVPESEGIDAVSDDTGPNQSLFQSKGDELAKDFEKFFTKLNDDHGFGLKAKAISMMTSEVRNAGQLPTVNNVTSFLESTASGISNATELNWIGRQYGLWREQYLQKRNQGGQMNMMGGSESGMMGGGMAGGGMGQDPMQGPGMMASQGQQGQMPGAGGMNPAISMMMQQMQQQMERLEERLEQDGQGGSEDILEEKTQEFLETKLEQLISSESPEEQQEVVQEIRQLRADMQDRGQQPTPAEGGDWRDKVIGLAQSGQMDVEDAKDLLKTLDDRPDDPEVLEKEMEKEIKQMELKHESARTEKIGEVFDTFAERLGQSFADSLTQRAQQTNGDGGQQTTPEEAQVETPERRQAPDDGNSQECKHCGAEMLVEANQALCPECEYGVMPCDVCHSPLEIPPIGGADYGKCAECENFIDTTEFDGDEVECGECEWEGTTDDLYNEGTKCDGCGRVRPIIRQSAMMETQAEVAELLDEDPLGD